MGASGVTIPDSVWDILEFWMNENLPHDEAMALAIMGGQNQQREQDAKIAREVARSNLGVGVGDTIAEAILRTSNPPTA